MKFGVVIPVFNEPRLRLLLERFDFSVTPHVAVVDDGSDDGSTEVAKNFPVTFLRHEKRTGVGAAIRTGLLHWKAQGFDTAVVMAGNNKDDPADIPKVLAPLAAGADYVQASRFATGAGTQNIPPLRLAITYAMPVVWSLRFARKLTEVTSGFRAYKLSILDHPNIDISQSWLNRYELEHYIHYKILSLGFRYAEVPIAKIYPKDNLPISKIKLRRDWWSLMRPLVLLSLRLKR